MKTIDSSDIGEALSNQQEGEVKDILTRCYNAARKGRSSLLSVIEGDVDEVKNTLIDKGLTAEEISETIQDPAKSLGVGDTIVVSWSGEQTPAQAE